MNSSVKAAPQLRLGLIGTGFMGPAHVEAYQKIGLEQPESGCAVEAVCDLRPEVLTEFANRFGIVKAYSDAAQLIDDPDIDAVSIITPDRFHASLSIAALEKGKHVLCEKPLAVDYGEAQRMVAAAQASGLRNMVNFSYRVAPALQQAQQIVASGEIGEIVHMEARYLQSWLSCREWRDDPTWLWRLSSEHGSKGALGDIGVHILDFASFPVSQQAGDIAAVQCMLQTFESLKGKQQGPYTLDANDSALISAQLENGALASIHTSRWATGRLNSLYLAIYGSKGGIKINLDESPHILQLCDQENKDRGHWYTVHCPATPSNYERFVQSIQTGGTQQPDFARGAKIQRVLDACFVSASERGRLVNVDEIS